jgi:hypothetical protein
LQIEIRSQNLNSKNLHFMDFGLESAAVVSLQIFKEDSAMTAHQRKPPVQKLQHQQTLAETRFKLRAASGANQTERGLDLLKKAMG